MCSDVKRRNPEVSNLQPSSFEVIQSRLEKRLQNKPGNYMDLLIYLLPEDQHIVTPTGYSPYDAELQFPTITLEQITGTPIGSAIVKPNYKLGYLLAFDHWGRGYAPEALAGMLREVWNGAAEGRFGTMPQGEVSEGMPKREYLEATVNLENTASQRVLEKVGAVAVGWEDAVDSTQTDEDKAKNGMRTLRSRVYRMYGPRNL